MRKVSADSLPYFIPKGKQKNIVSHESIFAEGILSECCKSKSQEEQCFFVLAQIMGVFSAVSAIICVQAKTAGEIFLGLLSRKNTQCHAGQYDTPDHFCIAMGAHTSIITHASAIVSILTAKLLLDRKPK